MTVTQETVVPTLLDSALLRADLEALLEALRRAESHVFGATSTETALETWCWEQVLERADLLRQSYSLAKARGALRGQGAGK